MYVYVYNIYRHMKFNWAAWLVTILVRYTSQDSCQRKIDLCPYLGLVGWFWPSIHFGAVHAHFNLVGTWREIFWLPIAVHQQNTLHSCTLARTFQTAVRQKWEHTYLFLLALSPSSIFFSVQDESDPTWSHVHSTLQMSLKGIIQQPWYIQHTSLKHQSP